MEEYLNKVFLEHHLSITHAKNKTGENGIPLYKGGKKCYYPDFYRQVNGDKDGTESFVLDAKYKRLGYDVAIDEQDLKNAISICREDLFQMISYMHVLLAKHCALLYPIERKDSGTHTIVESVSRQLLGFGGEIKGFGVPIIEMTTNTGEPIEYQQFYVSQNQVAKELSLQIQNWMKSDS